MVQVQLMFRPNMNVTGNIHATGNITADGDILLGDADTDNIIIQC